MKKSLLHINIFLCLLLLLNPSITAGEENQNILLMEELSIKVMPEFAYHPNDVKKEDPPLLIGYQGTMRNKSEQTQKGQIEIPLPVDDKNFRIGYVADYSSDLSKVYEIEYLLDQEKGTISWTTSEEIQPNDVYKFVIEFYIDTISVEKEKKTVSYQFKSFTEVGLFNVSFVEPLKAKKVVLEPAIEKKSNHAEEIGVHSYFFQGLKAGEEKSFTLSYEREETTPTFELMEKQEQQPLDTLDSEKSPAIFSIAAVSGIGLIAAGAFAFFMIRKREKI
ncbi:hypothetical protein [Neobacillus niacini]|uniref:hypothetical protein n=1 Tax=Neobacillus niacini TaxID=86668 RepID=UPI001C8DFDE9|nr:hypothetical protein [Neobacillus niacini]MBY0146513.1 hypothetical protein [Neobacillus niacini]